MASNLRAADILGIDWESRARNMQPRETPVEPRGVLSYWPGGTFRLEPAEVPRKNVLNDPDSWLNRGLSSLAGNAAEVILGRESGNSLVDLGAANVPGVGPAAILAAGGMPGLLDVAGAGELKNLSKIPKYTLEFVSRHFGERGLRNLDNALTRYPKAGKPSVNDAIYIMRTGLGGEQVPAIEAYRSQNALGDFAELIGASDPQNVIVNARDRYELLSRAPINRVRDLAERAYLKFNRGLEENDFAKIMNGSNTLFQLVGYGDMTSSQLSTKLDLLERALGQKVQFGNMLKSYSSMLGDNENLHASLRRFAELDESPLQDWEKIAAAQEKKDARDAEKALRKASRQVQEQPKQEMPKQVQKVKTAQEAIVPVEAVPEVAPEAPAITGGPNMWRENGWKSSQYSPNFFERFGSRLDENSKRDLFVLDSLKNHWVRQLGDPENRGFSAADILNGLERADARHTKTNYDRVSREFRKDIERNIESGNMPGTSIQYLQKFKNNIPVEGKTTPTLILRMEEKPKVFMDPRVWADEAEGPDLYELLFRPAVDRKLNSLNPKYWEY